MGKPENSRDTVVVSGAVKPDTKHRLDNVCELKDTTRSKAVKEAVEQWLDKNEPEPFTRPFLNAQINILTVVATVSFIGWWIGLPTMPRTYWFDLFWIMVALTAFYTLIARLRYNIPEKIDLLLYKLQLNVYKPHPADHYDH